MQNCSYLTIKLTELFKKYDQNGAYLKNSDKTRICYCHGKEPSEVAAKNYDMLFVRHLVTH